MDKNNINIVPFTGEKEKWHMWLGKFIEKDGMRGYSILLTGDMKIPADDAKETKNKEVTTTLKFLKKTAYNELILS